MDVTYFRRRKPGPEVRIEDAVANNLQRLFQENQWPLWVAGSVPIGAGLPDLVSVWYEPHVVSLADFTTTDGRILAYLRAVREARLDTIATRLRRTNQEMNRVLAQLSEVNAVLRRKPDVFSLSPEWRHILPKVVTVEAKVSDWKRAVQQAARNRLFAHKSFVALSCPIAERVRNNPVFSNLGIGIIAVSDSGGVRIARRAPNHSTGVWAYYFRLASLTAQHAFACPTPFQ